VLAFRWKDMIDHIQQFFSSRGIAAAGREPAPAAIVHVNPAAGLGIKIRPVTVSELVPEIFIALFAFTAAKVMVLAVAATLTVTVIPELMVTSSELVGTAAPPHVAVLLQFPETEAVRAAPFNM